MIDGSPFRELIASDGKPLATAQAAEEAHRLREETAKRKRETPHERRKRIDEYERGVKSRRFRVFHRGPRCPRASPCGRTGTKCPNDKLSNKGLIISFILRLPYN